MKTISKIIFWLKAIFVHRQIWLYDCDSNTKLMDLIYKQVYHRIWRWNLNNDWLTGDRTTYYDHYGIIDTLGTEYEYGKFIESVSCEHGSIYKIKLVGFEIVLQYSM